MSKVKIRSIIILAFALIAAIVLGAALAVPRSVGKADAATYSPTSVFSEGSGGDVDASAAEEGETSYVRFSFNNDGNVYYRRDLALKWYTTANPKAPEEEEEGDGGAESTSFESTTDGVLADAGIRQYFSMKFAFAPTIPGETLVNNATKYACPRCATPMDSENGPCPTCGFSTDDVIFFDRYEISFDSAEENISKAGKATNSIVFKVNGDGDVEVYIKNAAAHAAEEDKKDEEETDDLEGLVPATTIQKANIASDITIALSEAEEFTPGEFIVSLTVGEGAAQVLGSFTNVGGNFLEYRSSASSTPSTPITFNAKLAAVPEKGEEVPADVTYRQVRQCVHMKELNGQSFALENGLVTDNAPAVLVLNEQLFGFTLGQRYSLSWEAIDVCNSSVSSNGEYYMLRTDKEEGSEPTNHLPTDDDYKRLTTSTYFYPTYEGGAQEDQYVSIRYRLVDGRFNSDEEDKYDYVYLSWYAADGKVKTFADATGENKLDMLLVQNNDLRTEPYGPYYNGLKADNKTNPEKPANTAEGSTLANAIADYNKALNGEEGEEGAADKASAGNGAYIYLPSFRGLITSNYADYRNLRFTISYKKENSSTSASTESSLRYNNLRFQIDTEGHYAFKVCASDAAGNAMKYYLDGELVDVTTSNIWDIDEIPTFEFDVTYKGADVTEPGEQDPASRGTSFTFDEFEIVDLGSNIKEYTLYYFDTSKLPEGEETPAYSEFVENAKKYAEETFKDCLVEIKEYNGDISEDDDEWADTDNDHHWNPDSSLSFVPQKSGYYVLRLTYYDLYQPAGGIPEAVNYYEVVEVRNPYDYIPARSDWLQNNVTSVVLFAISGALAIAIVVLFVVKPSDKKVEEVDLASLKGNKKKDKPKKK